jgi:DNA-binding transcriptional ArsR family regulator
MQEHRMPEAINFPLPNRIIHEPARLAILVTLASYTTADFQFVQRATGLTKGNLSVQLANLEKAGLVNSSKKIVEKKTRTSLSLSEQGTAELGEYWRTMDEIRALMAPRAEPQPGSATGSAKGWSFSNPRFG